MIDKFYVYCLVYDDFNLPFYIGKGSGNRYKCMQKRSEHCNYIIHHFRCHGEIIEDNLSEQDAYRIEAEYKRRYKQLGYPIIDSEFVSDHQRQREGIEKAKQEGRIGRPALIFPANWKEIYNAWKAGEITAKKAMELTDTKRTSFYKLVKKM